MFGKAPRLNPLAARKEALLAESELNRAELIGEMTALRSDFRALKDRARSFGSIASLIAMVVAVARPDKTAAENAKPSWFKTIVNGAGLIAPLWALFRK